MIVVKPSLYSLIPQHKMQKIAILVLHYKLNSQVHTCTSNIVLVCTRISSKSSNSAVRVKGTTEAHVFKVALHN